MTNNVTQDAVSYVDVVADCYQQLLHWRCLSHIIFSLLRIWIFMKSPKFQFFKNKFIRLPQKQKFLSQ